MTGVKYLIAIVGPTAVGKTELAIKLSNQFGVDILSADSRQFYRELTIGTAKPSKEQLEEVRHHFINSHSIHDFYSAGRYEKDVLALLDSLFTQTSIAILVGGSGMYIDAVCNGLNKQPEVPEGIRIHYKNLFNENGLEPLLTELRELDRTYYDEVDQSNPQRVIRALEVCRHTGQKFSSFNERKIEKRPFKIVKVGLTMDRAILYKRIDYRMDSMIIKGLFEEAEHLYPFKDLYALQTVGYSEIFKFMDGAYDKTEAIRLLKRNSRRYAKRQLTWFKRDPHIKWFEPGNEKSILEFLNIQLDQLT